MESMSAGVEREKFSARLTEALANANIPRTVANMVAEYNHRAGASRVTPYAVRKWLSGEAIPTQEKIRILSNWLGVTSSWLRFGLEGDARFQLNGADIPATSSADRSLLDDFNRLAEDERGLVLDLIDAMAQMRRKPTSQQ